MAELEGFRPGRTKLFVLLRPNKNGGEDLVAVACTD
jgi:hypothetical protein